MSTFFIESLVTRRDITRLSWKAKRYKLSLLLQVCLYAPEGFTHLKKKILVYFIRRCLRARAKARWKPSLRPKSSLLLLLFYSLLVCREGKSGLLLLWEVWPLEEILYLLVCRKGKGCLLFCGSLVTKVDIVRPYWIVRRRKLLLLLQVCFNAPKKVKLVKCK